MFGWIYNWLYGYKEIPVADVKVETAITAITAITAEEIRARASSQFLLTL